MVRTKESPDIPKNLQATACRLRFDRGACFGVGRSDQLMASRFAKPGRGNENRAAKGTTANALAGLVVRTAAGLALTV
jgi:hypothetical protein